MSPVESIVITGRAYQRRATLEVAGDTLVWRARRGQPTVAAENIATTTHDVHAVRYVERRWSIGGVAIGALSAMWMASESVGVGGAGLGVALALIALRALRPHRWLGLDLGERWLVLRVDSASAARARALARRIEQRLLTGESPGSPSALP